MINIYEKNETTFTNNGIATLEPMTCDLTMTINGAWVLSIEHPYDQEGKWKELQKGRIIQVTDINILRNCSTSQRYRIYDTTETLTSIKAIAFPVGMEATYDAIIEEIRLKGKTGNQAVSALSTYLTDSGVTKYTLTVSGLSAKARTVEYKDTNLIAALCGQDDDSIVNKYNAEVAYNNYQIFIKDSIGSATNYDVRLGKNLTGLSYEIDDSDVVTRIYPLASDGVRLNEFNTGMSGENHYIDSLDIELFPYNRAAFVTVPYNLIDTDVDALVKTDTIIATKSAYDNIYDYVSESMERVWGLICAYNQFTYTHEQIEETILMVPELLQSLITNVSQTIAENVLTTKGVNHPGLRSWLTNAIKAGLDWIKEEDLPDKNWIQNQDNSYSYGNSLRKLTNEWANIDGKMSYFDANSKWVPEKDDPIAWDWVQKKGHNKKYGNNKRYCARDTYVYTMSTGGVFSQYWFDADGWWDEEGEESDWNWYQSGDKWWFGASDAGDNPSKYAHDTWLFIKSSNDASTSGGKPTLYYFGSDGFMVPSLSVVNIDWDWHQTKNKWYFGNTNTEYRAEYATEQWLYIDGDWYYFDENGYSIDIKIFPRAVIDILTDYLQYELVGDEIVSQQNNLYNLLYQLMEAYCNDLYADGLDKPLINVAIDFVDLSKTQEYASFSALETICLGDSVKVTYDTYGSYVEEEVVGLTYDCLKGCNTQITVGRASKTVSQMFDTSVKGADNGQRLVAGENVTITGNTINVSSQVGDVYAGDTVSVQQIQSTGTPIARISVNGVPTTIYAVGTDVEVEPIKTEGDKIATITVGGVDYDIYADTGLKYWVETETDIYRTGTRGGDLFVDDDRFLYSSKIKMAYIHPGDYQYAHWILWKKYETPCLIAAFRREWGQSQRDHVYKFILVAPRTNPDYSNGVNWWSQKGISEAKAYEGELLDPVEDGQEGSLVQTRACYTDTFTYKGIEWKSCAGNFIESNTANPYTLYNNIPIIDITDGTIGNDNIELARILIDAAGAHTEVEDIVGISNQDHILYYNDDKEGNYDTENRDDAVYISKDGVFNGTEYRVNGTPIGSFYKTNLYLGTSYSATVGLSDSYTDYDLLLIETYNQDDKNNLASMVNVSDLSTGSYIGVNEYLMYTITNGRTLTFHEAPNDSNHSRYVKAVYGFRTSHESGTQSPIEDVQVDDVSVVVGGVAKINNKQDKIIAGTNIQIGADGKTISATDTTYSDFAGSSHGLVPSASSGDSSKYLKGDGTWGTPDTGTTYTAGANIQISAQNVISATDTTYSDFSGSTHGLVPAPSSGDSNKYLKGDGTWDEPEGTAVIANPSGTATDTLTKIQVDNTIYEIQGGGSGGGSRTLLYSGSAVTGTITLSESYENFDYLYVVAYAVGEITALVDTEKLGYEIGAFTLSECSGVSPSSGSDMYVELVVTSSTVLTIANSYGGIVIKKIYGITGLGGGASALDDLIDVKITSPTNGQVLQYDGTNSKWVNTTPSGGGITRETIWTGAVKAVNDSGTLNKAISNYDYILVYGHPTDVPYEYHLDLLDVNYLLSGIANNSGYFSYEYYDTYYCRCKFSDETHFSCTQRNGGGQSYYEFTKMVGIKL